MYAEFTGSLNSVTKWQAIKPLTYSPVSLCQVPTTEDQNTCQIFAPSITVYNFCYHTAYVWLHFLLFAKYGVLADIKRGAKLI